MAITVRAAVAADAEVAGRICFEAFHKINTAHGFPPDIDLAGAAGVINALFNGPGFACWVAEREGRVVGSNCMDERDAIHGIGPITIDPAAQNAGAGRALMEAALA